jgi:peptidoglycan/xylan/chitin deacetylase (PgdA/CDA1 family)
MVLDAGGMRRAVAAAQRWRAGGVRVHVLAWHRVVPDFDRLRQRVIPGLLTSTRTFDRQLSWLADRFRFVSLGEALEILAGRTRAKRDVCALTFDDGYADFLEHAIPLLRKHGAPATLYVPTGFVGTGVPLLHDRLYQVLRRASAVRLRPTDARCERDLRAALEWNQQHGPIVALERMLETWPLARCLPVAEALEQVLGMEKAAALTDSRLLTWEELRAVQAAGFEVGGHTVDHACLPNETAQEVERQLRESKLRLEAKLETQIHDFAYPNGWYSRSRMEQVRACGYRSGVTTEDQPNRLGENPYALKRKYVWELSSQGLFGYSQAVTACNLDDTLRSLGLAPWVPGERPAVESARNPNSGVV